MTTLRIASSTLVSPILFAEHKVFVSAYPAVPKTPHTIGSVLLLHNTAVRLGVGRQLFLCVFVLAEHCGWHQAPSCLQFRRRALCHGSGGCSQAAPATKALTLGVHHASCLAHSNGIPGSVPSDCRLAPLPPSLAHKHTHAQASPCRLRFPHLHGCSNVGQRGIYIAAAHLAHSSPFVVFFVCFVLLQITVDCNWCLPLQSLFACFLFFAFLCRHSTRLVKRSTRLFSLAVPDVQKHNWAELIDLRPPFRRYSLAQANDVAKLTM